MRDTSFPLSVGFEKIVVATDFSRFSNTALETAMELALCFRSRILLLHVIDPLHHASAMDGVPFLVGMPGRDARERLESSAAMLRSSGIACEVILRTGNIRDSIYQVIVEQRANLLVLGTHGPNRFDRLVCSSNAEKFLRVAPCPVITVGPLTTPRRLTGNAKRRLLFPTHLKDVSLRALPFVDAWAHYLGAELHLLSVCRPGQNTLQARKEAVEMLDRAAEKQVRLAPDVFSIAEAGELGETIAAVASSIEADFIGMGVRREDLTRRPAGGLHLGLVYQIVSKTACPVLTLNSSLPIAALRAAQASAMASPRALAQQSA